MRKVGGHIRRVAWGRALLASISRSSMVRTFELSLVCIFSMMGSGLRICPVQKRQCEKREGTISREYYSVDVQVLSNLILTDKLSCG